MSGTLDDGQSESEVRWTLTGRAARIHDIPRSEVVILASEPQPPIEQEPLRYRLLTGAGDRAFCERISQALDEGYSLYGDPTLTIGPDGQVVSAQAVIR